MTAPVVTKFSAVASGMAGILGALYTHFNGTSTHWEIDPRSTANGSPAGSDGFTIRPKSDPVLANWQVNFRRKDTDETKLVIDPNGAITNAGNTGSSPTGASTRASTEDDHFKVASTTTNTITLLEWADAIMILAEDTGLVYHEYAVHVGRVYAPAWANGVALGQDGLGVLSTQPNLSSISPNWGDASGKSRARVASTGTVATDWVNTSLSPTSLAASDQSLGGVSQPCPVAVELASSSARILGLLKYCAAIYPPKTPKTRYQDSGGVERYMAIHDTNATTNLVVLWPDNTTP